MTKTKTKTVVHKQKQYLTKGVQKGPVQSSDMIQCNECSSEEDELGVDFRNVWLREKGWIASLC